MTKISMIVVLSKGKAEVVNLLSHMQKKHPDVKLLQTTTDSNALIELTCPQETTLQNAAAEIKRGLKINNCRIWHEHVIRGAYA